MDNFVKNLLISWNLPDLVKIFSDEEVDEEAFKYLKYDMIKELIPKVGRRAIFVQKYDDYKENVTDKSHTSTVKDDQAYVVRYENGEMSNKAAEPLAESEFLIKPLPVSKQNEIIESLKADVVPPVPVISSPRHVNPSTRNKGSTESSLEEEENMYPVKRIKLEQDFGQNVLEMLSGDAVEAEEMEGDFENDESQLEYSQTNYYSESSTSYEPRSNTSVRMHYGGKDALDLVEVAEAAEELRYVLNASILSRHLLKLKKLTPPQRTTIVNVVVHHLIHKHEEKRVPQQLFKTWAYAINTVFPTENVEIYYRIQIKKSGQHYTAGKLYDKHQNLRRKCSFRKSNNENSAKHDNYNNVDERRLVSYLRHAKTVEEARDNWLSSIKSRTVLLQQNSYAHYLGMFPALRRPDGYTLFTDEFDYTHPDYKKSFTHNWTTFAKKIIKQAEKLNIPDVVEDFSMLNYELNILNSAFYLLPYIFKTIPKKHEWYPSKYDVLQDFIIHVHDISELTPALSAREELLKSVEKDFLPLIATVGESISQLEIIYIRLNKIFYKFTSLTEAVETCIKIYVALHIPYRLECGFVWLFLQKFVMGLDLPSNNCTSIIYNLITDLN